MWANLSILFPSNKGGSKWHFQFYSSANQKNKQTNKPTPNNKTDVCRVPVNQVFVVVGRQEPSGFLPSVVRSRAAFRRNFVIRTQKKKSHQSEVISLGFPEVSEKEE